MASKGVNSVTIIGNLGQDPECKHMPNGDAVTTISVATSESWKDKNTGEQKQVTEWHRIVMFRKLAEIAGQYLRKGSQVYINGKLKTRKWQDQSGQDRYTTEIVADNMQMLGGNQSQGQQQGQQQPQQGYNQAPQQAAPQGGFNQAHQQPQQAAPQMPAPSNEFDDSIPF